MITVAFPARARAVLNECLAQPYPSASAGGEIAVEHDERGRHCLVLTDVPTGLGADALVIQVAEDVRNGLVLRIRAIHNESSEARTRVVFTPTADADLDSVTGDLRASFERSRLAVAADHSRIRAEVADQDLVVKLPADDWFVVHGVLADACARRPTDSARADAARLVEVSLYGDEDE